MTDRLLALLTRENITLALAILGSLGTLFTWAYNFLQNRKNISVHIVGHRYSDFDENSFLLYMSFVNNSRIPISITSISINVDGIYHSCQEIPITTFEETTRCKDKILSHHEYKSMPLPIALAGLSGTSGYVYFEFPEGKLQSDATHLIVQVSTNRGKAIEKKLSLGRHLD